MMPSPAATELPIAPLKAELFKALAHPARVRVLEILADGERSVGEIAALIELDMAPLSQQLGVLRKAGVVTTRRDGTSVYYSLRDERMRRILGLARELVVAGLQDSRSMLESIEATR